MRSLALPATDVWETILGKRVKVEALEYNEATLEIVRTGKNPTLRHVPRGHGEIRYQYTRGQEGHFLQNWSRTARLGIMRELY